ncbi:MAG: hypothetical protein KC445_18625 [Anaerolineales bacterium]|nr:hypothetical protein [Anaerolineales bacterium]
MTNQTLPEIFNIGYLGTNTNSDHLDKMLRSIIDLSTDASDYIHDRITVAYRSVGPLHFNFLPVPFILRYNTGILVWERIEKPLILQSQGILVDFGVYLAHSKNTDGYPDSKPFLVWATKRFQKPTVYMVHGVEEQVEMGLLKPKMMLEESDILMVNDEADPDSLKKILQKLVEITL